MKYILITAAVVDFVTINNAVSYDTYEDAIHDATSSCDDQKFIITINDCGDAIKVEEAV